MFTKAGAEAYFNAEKSESGFFVIIGVLAIMLALSLFLIYKTPFYKGLAIPLLLIGLVQGIVGYNVWSRSDKQRVDIVYKMDMNPSAITTTEVPRMEKVMQSFKLYRYVELALLLIGLALYFYTRNKDNAFWTGVAVALSIQAGIMLFADGIAEARGKKYLDGLKAYSGKAANV
ncbi:MAG: hypothetical protein V4717_16680 [Bacteroidota bacterium]